MRFLIRFFHIWDGREGRTDEEDDEEQDDHDEQDIEHEAWRIGNLRQSAIDGCCALGVGRVG